MKTLRLNSQNKSIDSIELNEQTFQIWANGCIVQLKERRYFKIQNSYNFRWATNFSSFGEAQKHANILIEKENKKGAVKIFSGNILYAQFEKGEWEILEKPLQQLM